MVAPAVDSCKDSKAKDRDKSAWSLWPLPAAGIDNNESLGCESIWTAISRLGRIFYSYAEDPVSDALLVDCLTQLHDETEQMPREKRLAIGAFAFEAQDLWEGESLYQFLQGLHLTAKDRQHGEVEAIATKSLALLYAVYADCLKQTPVVVA